MPGKYLNFEVTPDLYRRVEEEAKRIQNSKADLMRRIAVEYFEKQDFELKTKEVKKDV